MIPPTTPVLALNEKSRYDNPDLFSRDNSSATTSCNKKPQASLTMDELGGQMLQGTSSVELVHYGGTKIISTFEGREVHSYILLQLPSGTVEYEIAICNEDTSMVELTFPGDSQASGIIFGEAVLNACRNAGFSAETIETLTLAQDNTTKNHTQIPSTKALIFAGGPCQKIMGSSMSFSMAYESPDDGTEKTLTCLLIHAKLECADATRSVRERMLRFKIQSPPSTAKRHVEGQPATTVPPNHHHGGMKEAKAKRAGKKKKKRNQEEASIRSGMSIGVVESSSATCSTEDFNMAFAAADENPPSCGLTSTPAAVQDPTAVAVLEALKQLHVRQTQADEKMSNLVANLNSFSQAVDSKVNYLTSKVNESAASAVTGATARTYLLHEDGQSDDDDDVSYADGSSTGSGDDDDFDSGEDSESL